jgi:hypothetical protein
MAVRPFDWRDLPSLHRLRHNSIFLNSSLLLTRGQLLVPGALLSYFAPGVGIFTYVSCSESDDNDPMVIGQVIHTPGSPSAHLTYFTPVEALSSKTFSNLLEYLMKISGRSGARQLVADVDESSAVFEALRKENFAIYTRQRIWRLDNNHNTTKNKKSLWRTAESLDGIGIRLLYYDVVPGIVQQVEPVVDFLNGLVYYDGDRLLGYVDLKYGHKGIWAQPFFHPSIEDTKELFLELTKAVPNRLGRPLYLCLRSYQSWLEPALEAMDATVAPKQAVMVKHLAVPRRMEQEFTMPKLEGRTPEVTAQMKMKIIRK